MLKHEGGGYGEDSWSPDTPENKRKKENFGYGSN